MEINQNKKHKEEKLKKLWRQFVTGDEAAFKALYDLSIQEMMLYGEKISPSLVILEESIQDLFTDLWENRKNYTHVQSVKFFLLGSLKNKILKHIRKEKRYTDSNPSELPAFNLEYSYETTLIENEIVKAQAAQLAAFLNKLPDREKEALYLKYYEGLSYDEVAAMMNINKRTVYNLIHKAIQYLRKNLSYQKIMIQFLLFTNSFFTFS